MRILWSLGIREEYFRDFAGEPEAIHFYKTIITNPSGSFFVMPAKDDFLHQALPNGVTHVQPKLEANIADAAIASGHCEIRRGANVVEHEILADRSIAITYLDSKGNAHTIRCSYLIGADGKRGVVRKSFLEPNSSIRQVSNHIYQYEGTWVASNLQLTLPTPETHPQFPLWTLGYTPEDVFDLFCPKAWYFCSPPGKPTAGGRFGPASMKLWRHEFAQPDWNDSMDAEALFWEHFTPFITRTHDIEGQRLPCGAVTYPRDCIKILRCRSFTFTHKVVNRWFDQRRILIGDAAHVFPPFGGQGIASGMRDAHQLAWRIAYLESITDVDEALVDKMLNQWANERRKSINAATFQTKLNGQLCNEPESWSFYLFRKFLGWYEMLPFVPLFPSTVGAMDKKGFKNVADGFLLREYGGGGKFPQIFCENEDGVFGHSDDVLDSVPALLKLLVLNGSTLALKEARNTVQRSGLPRYLLNEDSIVTLTAGSKSNNEAIGKYFIHPATPEPGSCCDVRSGYREEAFREWLGKKTVFAILRPDFYVFALLETGGDLDDALRKLGKICNAGRNDAKL